MSNQKSRNATVAELKFMDETIELLRKFQKDVLEGNINLHTQKMERIRQTMDQLLDVMSKAEDEEGQNSK